MDKKSITIILVIFSIFLLIVLNYNFLSRIVGLVTSTINVSIEEKTSGRLIVLFEPLIELGDTQSIYAEFINIGSTVITARIEETIYLFENGTLNDLAYYYDSTVPLNPGMRRSYTTVFIPPSAGLYYIKTKVPYDHKVLEVWNTFTVYYPPIYVTVPPVTPRTVPGPAPAPTLITIKRPGVSLEYPEKVRVFQGEHKLINITVKNTGNIDLHALKLYVSTSSLLNFSVNPKTIAKLDVNDSAVFLISIYTAQTTPTGTYPFEFKLLSTETKKDGEITVEVVPMPISEAEIEEEIRSVILNYEYLISEIEHEILSAYLKGYDVSLANQSLNTAKQHLETAKELFRMKRFADARSELRNVMKNLEDAVLRLASAVLYIYRPPAVFPYFIILIIVILVAVILVYLYHERKKEKRPKLLRALTETEK